MTARAAALFLAILLALAPAAARAEPSAAVAAPSDAQLPPPDARWKTVAAGLGTTAFFWAAASGASLAWPDAPGSRDLRAPVIGPFRAIAHNGCATDDPDYPNCSKPLIVFRTILFLVDGAAQVGGLAIAAEGLFLPTQLPASPGPRSTPPTPSPSSPGNLYYVPMPTTVGSGFGLTFRGAF